MSYYALSYALYSWWGENCTKNCSSEQVLTHWNQSDPCLLQSTCQVSLGEILTLTLLSDASIGVWMLHRKHLSMEKHSCMSNASCIEHSDCSGREVLYKNQFIEWRKCFMFVPHFLEFYFMLGVCGVKLCLKKHMDDEGLNQIPRGTWMSIYVNVHIHEGVYVFICMNIYIYICMCQSIYINIVF